MSEPEGYHRHHNPDDTVGGLVSDDSHVDPTVYVGFDAQVMDGARVTGNVKILDQAYVGREAIISGNVILRDRAQIFEATIKDNVEISGDACMTGQGRSSKSGLTISGNSRFHNVSVGVSLGTLLNISGGEYVLPEGFERAYLVDPALDFTGSYDGKTGAVAIEHVGVRRAGDEPLVVFPNEQELLNHIELTMPKNRPYTHIGRNNPITWTAYQDQQAKGTRAR